MTSRFSRRSFFQVTAGTTAGAVAAAALRGQQAPEAYVPHPIYTYNRRAKVALVRGKSRRRNVHDALLAIEDQILPILKTRKQVVIKPNNVSWVNQLASTHVDCLHGILDFLAPRFQGPIVIAESCGDTLKAFANFGYAKVVTEHKPRPIALVDLNRDSEFESLALLSPDLHVQPVRLAARLFSPDTYYICAAVLKTHNVVVATLSVKNMTVSAPVQSLPGETPHWNEKRKYHGGIRQTHYNIMLTAQKMRPFWGATVIDGFEGMEGNGPASGQPVPSRVAIASTDYVAADRVAVEAMGIDPNWVGYLQYCWQVGLGQYDLNRIDLIGADLASIRRTYRLHADIERELQWMGPLTDLPPKLG